MGVSGSLGLGLSASVGDRGGVNRTPDVRIVQDALNALPASEGGQTTLLSLDGIAGRKTNHAIQMFQLHHFGWSIADGRVDPGGRTSRRLAELLNRHGGTRWSIERVESAVPTTPGATTRNIDSRDRLYQVSTLDGRTRVLYYVQTSDQHIPRGAELPQLRERTEFNQFTTPRPCSAFGLVGQVAHTEQSFSPTNAVIQLTLQPLLFSSSLHITVRHTWFVQSSTPGISRTLHGVFRFMRDDSTGGHKVAGSG